MKAYFFWLTLLAVIGCQSAWAVDEWHWVRIGPPMYGDKWEVLEGSTSVKFEGQKFSTVLMCGSGGTGCEIPVSGTITGNRVVATEILPGTEMPPETYRGGIKKFRTRQKWGYDSITLTNGPWFIGLYRYAATSK